MKTLNKLRRRRKQRQPPTAWAPDVVPAMGVAAVPAESIDALLGERFNVWAEQSQNQNDTAIDAAHEQACPVPDASCVIGGESFKLKGSASMETVAVYVWSREDTDWRHCGAIRHADTDGAHAVLDAGVTGEEDFGQTWPHREELIEVARQLEVDTND